MPSLALDRQSLQIPQIQITGDFTIESWIYLTPRGNDPAGAADGLFKGRTDSGDTVSLNFHATHARLFSHANETAPVANDPKAYNTQGDQIVTTDVPNAGDWTHYALVREGGVLTFYINGKAAETSKSQEWNDNFVITHLGAGHNSGSLKGRVDEFRVWNDARTDEEIESNYQHTVPGDSAGLARNYRFDQDDVIRDITGGSEDVSLGGDGQPTSSVSLMEADANVLTPIAIGNSGFEQPVTKGTGAGQPEVGRWVLSGDVGTFMPNAQQIDNGAPEGMKVAYINSRGEFSQTLEQTVQRTENGVYLDYVLRVKIGDDKSDLGDATSWQVRLYAGDTLLGRITSQEVNVSDGAFAQAELVIPADQLFEMAQRAAVYGQKLKIVLSDTGDAEGQVRFDDVKLFSRASSFEPPEDNSGKLGIGESIMLDFQAADRNLGSPPPVTSRWDPDGDEGPMGNFWNPFSVGPGTTHGNHWQKNSVTGGSLTTDADINLEDLRTSEGRQTDISLNVVGRFGAYNSGGGQRNDPTHIDSLIRDHHYIDLKKYAGDRWNPETQEWTVNLNSFAARGPVTHTYSGLQAGTYSLEFFINPTRHDPPREYEVNINGETEADGQTLKWVRVRSEVTSEDRGGPDSDNRLTVNDISVGQDGELRIQYRSPDDAAGGDPSPTGAILTFVSPEAPSTSDPDINDQQTKGRFSTELVAPKLDAATDLKFLPDGSLLVLGKEGQVVRYADPSNGDMTPTTILTIPPNSIETGAERGLLAVEVDPDFSQNGFIYLFYSKVTETGEVQTTVSRFSLKEQNKPLDLDAVDPASVLASEQVIWQENDEVSHNFHQGGGLSIGWNPVDGKPSGKTADPMPYKLFITTGEEFAPASSADLEHPDGKTHRVNLDGSIPTDNPYYDQSAAGGYDPAGGAEGALHEGKLMTIWSYGLRNPWRAHFDEQLQRLFIGEVGGNNNKRGGSTEDIHVAEREVNHGWTGEGSEESYSQNDGGTPLHSYSHFDGPGSDGQPLSGANGASVTGGLVYRFDGEGKFKFPDEYQGKYFYGDWVRNWIRTLDIEETGQDTGHKLKLGAAGDEFFSNTPGQPLAFTVGPDGAIYFITTHREGGVFEFSSRIYRIVFSDNLPLTGTGIVIEEGKQVSTTLSEDGHTVSFSVDIQDPDGPDSALTYRWDFDYGRNGDDKLANAISTEKSPTFTYTEKGVFTVLLTVTDATGATTTFDIRKIRIGNPPEVTLEGEAREEGLFEAGEYARFKASATDVEDGDLPSGSISWGSELVHNEHSHPGGSGIMDEDGYQVFFIPNTGHGYPGSTFYKVSASARDSSGMENAANASLNVKKTTIELIAPDAGYQFERVGSPVQPETGSSTVQDVAVGFQEVIKAQPYIFDGTGWRLFSHWEDDPTNTNPIRLFKVPEGGLTLQPVYGDRLPVTDPIMELDGQRSIELAAGSRVSIAEDDDFTVEMWVYLEDPINNHDGLFYGTKHGGGRLDLNFWQAKPRLHHRDPSGEKDKVTSKKDEVTSKIALTEKQWSHVALVREDSKLKLYVNGHLAAEHDPDDATESWSSGFNITHFGKSIAGNLAGYLDKIRVWSGAKTGDDISDIHAQGRAGPSDSDGQATQGLRHDFRIDSHTGRLKDFVNPSSDVIGKSKFSFDIPDWTVAENADFTIETSVRIPTEVNNYDSIAFGRLLGSRTFDLNFFNGQFRLHDGRDRIISEETVSPDTWAHVAIVRQNGLLKVYVNGQVTESSQRWTKGFTLTHLNKGLKGDGNSLLDHFRLWSVARTEEELSSHRDQSVQSGSGLEHQFVIDNAAGLAVDTVNSERIGNSNVENAPFAVVDASVTGTPDAPDKPPVPVPDHAVTLVGRPVSVTVLENDVDDLTKPGDLSLVAATLQNPAHGSVTIDAAKGLVIFTPGQGVSGRVSIRYEVADSSGNRGFGELNVFVGFNNRLPVPVDDHVTMRVGESREIDVLANDIDVEGDPLVLVGGSAANGQVSVTADGKLSYRPNDGFFGTDEITYQMAQGGELEAFIRTAKVSVEVTPWFVPDAPVLIDTAQEFTTIFHLLENDAGDAFGSARIISATAKFGSVEISENLYLKYAIPETTTQSVDRIIYEVEYTDGHVETAYLDVMLSGDGEQPEFGWYRGHADGNGNAYKSLIVLNNGLLQSGHADTRPDDGYFVPDAPIAVTLGSQISIGHIFNNDLLVYQRVTKAMALNGEVSAGSNRGITYSSDANADYRTDVIYYEMVDLNGEKDRGYLQVVLHPDGEQPNVGWFTRHTTTPSTDSYKSLDIFMGDLDLNEELFDWNSFPEIA